MSTESQKGKEKTQTEIARDRGLGIRRFTVLLNVNKTAWPALLKAYRHTELAEVTLQLIRPQQGKSFSKQHLCVCRLFPVYSYFYQAVLNPCYWYPRRLSVGNTMDQFCTGHNHTDPYRQFGDVYHHYVFELGKKTRAPINMYTLCTQVRNRTINPKQVRDLQLVHLVMFT